MEILSHRGYWKKINEKNSLLAFKRSFELGFGTETDIRDYNSKLVISHDMATKDSILLEEFFEIYCNNDKKLPLALNIKADGLQTELINLITKYEIENYFVFDMSVPDGVQYLAHKLNVFTRKSEYEIHPAYYEESIGIWLDEFKDNWITLNEIKSHLLKGKKVCIVSPELHRREYLSVWMEYLKINSLSANLMICTDFPDKAKTFFNED